MTLDELFALCLPLIAVGTFLAIVGQGIGKVIGKSRKGWRGIWHRTTAFHPVLAGLLIGSLTTLPVPEAMGTGFTARLIWYGLAGGLAVPIYEMVQRFLKQKPGG